MRYHKVQAKIWAHRKEYHEAQGRGDPEEIEDARRKVMRSARRFRRSIDTRKNLSKNKSALASVGERTIVALDKICEAIHTNTRAVMEAYESLLALVTSLTITVALILSTLT